MWRSIFLAIGAMAIIVGFETLFIESANFYPIREAEASTFSNPLGSGGIRQWSPQDWFPWAVLGTGAVVILYAFTLPRRWGNAG